VRPLLLESPVLRAKPTALATDNPRADFLVLCGHLLLLHQCRRNRCQTARQSCVVLLEFFNAVRTCTRPSTSRPRRVGYLARAGERTWRGQVSRTVCAESTLISRTPVQSPLATRHSLTRHAPLATRHRDPSPRATRHSSLTLGTTRNKIDLLRLRLLLRLLYRALRSALLVRLCNLLLAPTLDARHERQH
jgi:hypothetical protein